MDRITVLGRGKAGRSLATALGVRNEPHDTSPSGLVILAVPDHAIAETATRFRGRCVHLSGSLHLDDVPCLHPLTSFDGHRADWTGTPLATTGDAPPALVDAFVSVGFVPFPLPPEHKARYHAAAVLTSGHAATLWIGAEHMLREVGVALPGRGLLPLAEATLRNIALHGAAGRTGPFVRGDRATIARDAAALPAPWRTVFLALGGVLDPKIDDPADQT